MALRRSDISIKSQDVIPRQLYVVSLVTMISLLCYLWTVSAQCEVIALESFDYSSGSLESRAGGSGWAKAGWKASLNTACYVFDGIMDCKALEGSETATGRVAALHGTRSTHVPLRRELAQPFTGDSLFVRFLLKYDAKTLDDTNSKGDGEFFVLWLDDIDGGDGAGHTVDVPNIGLHIPDQDTDTVTKKNRFMVRFNRNSPKFSQEELKGDHTYLIVAQLSKTKPGPLSPYDRLAMWIDPPLSEAALEPDCVVLGRTINSVRWLGFRTGRKTEPEDLILIDELILGERWQDVVPKNAFGAGATQEHSKNVSPIDKVSFQEDIYPILRERCFDCHQGRDSTSGHRLDVREELLGHFQGRPLVIVGDSSNSPLYQSLITKDEDLQMPLEDEPLSEQEIGAIKAWIDQGVAWDKKLLPTVSPKSDHWSFQRIERPEIPQTKRKDWGNNPIDAFIASLQERQGLVPSNRSNRRTLLRRVTLDLTGLPPTPKEIDDFLSDDSPNAYQSVINRLLQSTAYGERWARHWLDVARWSESDGYQHNVKRSSAWRYRDYVVNSFVENKPFDEFIRQQIAGDEISPYTDENLVATGFLASTLYSSNERDSEVQRNDVLVDITNTTASAFLGLTMQCAQCHSHKFDPINARDYYRFQGFFIKGQPASLLLHGDEDSTSPHQKEKTLNAIDQQYDMLAATEARLAAGLRKQGLPVGLSPSKIAKQLPAEQKKRFKEINALIGKYDRTWGFYSPVTSATSVGVPYLMDRVSPMSYSLHQLQRAQPVLYIRGDVKSPGPIVDVGWPSVFGQSPDKEKLRDRPRTVLVDWLTSRDNPLTARVWVNRVWLYHFGRGLVTTPNDFGDQGAKPTHPQLLDWLAVELIESGWDTGHIHRLILESSTYQQASSGAVEANREIDPDNQYYWRWSTRRLEAEAIRDLMLAVSGLLEEQFGGPSVGLSKRQLSRRRTIYLEQKRGHLPIAQRMFDSPNTLTSCGNRRTSTVALQPLFLLNDPHVLEVAEALANRVTEEVGGNLEKQRLHAFELVLGRKPDKQELEFIREFFLDPDPSKDGLSDAEQPRDKSLMFVYYCHALLNLNEFIYIP